MANRDLSLDELGKLERELARMAQQLSDIRRDLKASGRESFQCQTGTFLYHVKKLRPHLISMRSSADRSLLS
jgi:hypothetical protein